MEPCPRRGGVKLPFVSAVASAAIVVLTGLVGLRTAAPDLGWSLSLPGAVQAPPAAGEGELVFCTADNHVRAVDLETGERRWERADLRAFATPLIAGGRVFVASLDDVVLALDARTGADVWRGESDGYRFALHGAELLVGRGRGFDVLDARTGRLAWEYRASRDSGDEIQVTEGLSVADDVAYVAYSLKKDFTLSYGNRAVVKGGVYAVELAGGRRLWTAPVEDRVMHPPVVGGGGLYVKTTSGLVNSVYALDRAKGSILWKHTGADGVPRLAGGAVCFANVDSRTTKRGPLPLLEERYAYVGLDPATGEERWSHGAPPDLRGTLVHGERVLFVREGGVDAREGRSGGRAWRLPIEPETSARPTVAAGRLIVCTADARLSVYPLD